jgi:macrolide-specific efflux system membrane fusion protein
MLKIITRIFWGLLFVAVLWGGYAYIQMKRSIQHEAVAVVKRGDVIQTVFAMADVVSAGSVDLSFKIDGKVVFMGVRVGEKVRKGQKIAEIDTGTLEQQIRQAKENIAFQTSTLDNMKLYKNKDIFTKAQKEAQNANINSARSALSALKTQLDETILYAPADGLVTKKNFNVGEVVSAGSVVVSIAGENDLEVRARVPEAAINKVSVGQMALATFDALPNEKIELRVLEIEPDATVIQGNHYYLVKLQLPTQDSRIRNGMSPEIRIVTATRSGVLMIPISAIRLQDGEKFVEVLNADQQTTRMDGVTVGLQGDGGMLEVTHGISEGEQIIL